MWHILIASTLALLLLVQGLRFGLQKWIDNVRTKPGRP